MRNEGEDIELQRSHPGSEKPGATRIRPISKSMLRTHSPTSGSSAPPSSSSESFATPGSTALTRPSGRLALLDDLEPDELEGVVLVLLRRRQRVARRPRAACRAAPRRRGGSRAGLRTSARRRPRARRRRRAASRPTLNQRGSSLASSTTNEPSSPCGRPTRPTTTRSLIAPPAVQRVALWTNRHRVGTRVTDTSHFRVSLDGIGAGGG